MSAQAAIGESRNYVSRFAMLAWLSLIQLVRAPSHSRRAEAARRAARHILLLAVVIGAVIIQSMYVLDAWEIAQMPARGSASLWWARFLTDFGKDTYVLETVGGLLIAVALVAPAWRGIQRSLLLGLGTRLQFVFFAVLVPVVAGEAIKWIVGRGRPFAGGDAGVFHFSHFAGTQAYSSFPSNHSITAFALAVAVSAVWPRTRPAMFAYAVIIVVTRLALLAHHPSDVIAGALIGIVGAMAVRYWFAARRLGFAIHRDGSIASLVGPSPGRLKRVARGAFAS